MFTWELEHGYLPLTLLRHSLPRTLPLTPRSLVDSANAMSLRTFLPKETHAPMTRHRHLSNRSPGEQSHRQQVTSPQRQRSATLPDSYNIMSLSITPAV